MNGCSTALGEVVVRFPTHPHSVRTSRQLVVDTLRAWDLDRLVDDARLVVSELATNATLHSGVRSFLLSVTSAGDGVRIAVGDEGVVPAAAVVRRARPGDGTTAPLRSEATTGRGLGIVEELASAWGVDVDGPTKWVWVDLTSDAEAAVEPTWQPTAAQVEAPLPPGWHVVRLLDCPVGLSLAQDDHLDELVRELQLLGPSHDEPELAPVIRGLLEGQAQARHMGRRTAQDAAAAGRAQVTVEMVLPSVAADEVERLDEAVGSADALCERVQLLTLASPPEVRRLRSWMRAEVSEQIRHARRPRSYDEWRAAADRS